MTESAPILSPEDILPRKRRNFGLLYVLGGLVCLAIAIVMLHRSSFLGADPDFKVGFGAWLLALFLSTPVGIILPTFILCIGLSRRHPGQRVWTRIWHIPLWYGTAMFLVGIASSVMMVGSQENRFIYVLSHGGQGFALGLLALFVGVLIGPLFLYPISLFSDKDKLI